MRKYRYKKRDGTWSKDLGLTALMTVAAQKIVAGKGPFRINQDNKVLASDLKRLECLSRLRKAVSWREVGSTFRVRNGDGTIVFTTRAVRVDTSIPETNSTSGNQNADRLYNWVMSEFKEYSPRYAGAYVCKTTTSGGTSQHSFGNAIDFFFDTLAHQDKVAEAAVAKADELRLYHAITQRRIWTKGVGWHAYTGDFHGHGHFDFDPQFSGDCGVKGVR